MRWTLRQKILFGFGLGWIGMVLIGLAGYIISTNLIAYSRQTEHVQQVHDTLHFLHDDLGAVDAGIYRFIFTGDERYLNPARPHFTGPQAHLQTLQTLSADLPHNTEITITLDALTQEIDQYFAQIASLAEIPPSARQAAAQALLISGSYQTHRAKIELLIDTWDQAEIAYLTAQTTRNHFLSNSAGWFIGLMVLVALGITVLSGVSLTNQIGRATAELMRGAREFSLGHLSYRIPSPSHDEMASLAHAYNQMAERLATAQTDVLRSNALFEHLFEASPDAIITTTLQGEITLANTQAEALYGYPREELVGMRVEALIPDPLREIHRKHEQAFAAHPTLHQMGRQGNFQVKTKSGAIIPVDVMIAPLPIEAPPLVLCVTRDISAQKQAEAALRAQTEQIYDLYNRAPCGYHSIDAEGVFVAINDTELQWLGYPREELVGKIRVYDLLTPTSQQTYWQAFASFLKQGYMQDLELEFVRADGTLLSVILNATALLDAQGNFLMSRTTLFDNTALKQAREALEQTNAELEQRVAQRTAELARSEKEFRTLAENSLVGIFRTQLDGEVIYANEAMIRILEYPSVPEARVLSAFSHFQDPSDEQAIFARLQQRGAVENYEVNVRTAQGKTRTVLISLTLDGEMISGMAIDVTLRKQAETRLQEYNRRMAALAEASRVFTEASLNYDSVLENITRYLAESFGDLCFIRLVSSEEVWEDRTAVFDNDPTLREAIQANLEPLDPKKVFSRLSKQVLDTGVPRLIEEITAESLKSEIRQAYWPLLSAFQKFSIMLIPMQYRKRIIGSIYFIRHTALRPAYTQGDLDLVNELAERAGLAITNARLFELVQKELVEKSLSEDETRRFNAILEKRVEERTAQLAEINYELQSEIYERKQLEAHIRQNEARAQALADFSQALAESPADYRPIFDVIARKISEILGDSCNISLISKDGQFLETVAVYHPDPEHLALIKNLLSSTPYPLGEGVAGKVAQEGTAVIIPAPPPEQIRARIKPEFHPILERYGLGSLIIVPMRARDRILGTIGISRDRDGAPYTVEEQIFLQDLANRAGQALENHRLYQEALTARQEAVQANQAKSEFLSRISHELRTPLNAILGFAQILGLDELSKGQTNAVHHILTAGKHLLNLINEVLDITRIEVGNLAISPEPVRVRDVAQETLDLVEAIANEYRVHLKISISANCYVKADRQRLKQALLNLITNAIKYNKPEGVVWLNCMPVNDDLMRITIQDTGPGISSELQKRLFIPFDRLGAERTNVEGTGLGLSLSRRLIEAMGGRLGVESELGKGSMFWIELAVAENPLEQTYHPEDGLLHLSPLRESEQQYQVLSIEDNLSNLQLLEEVFKHRPAVNLLAAMDGKTGLEAARKHTPHIILLDLNLPDMPGHEVVLQLKADPKTAHIPIVVVSADATANQQQHLAGMGIYKYLTKPLEIGVFLNVMDEILGT